MGIVVDTGCPEPWSDRTLRTMFEDRKSVFVDLLKWDVPVLADCFELDEFDDPHATYLIIADEDGDHLGSARLLPTSRPHILSTLFMDLCAAPPPRGGDVFEITRLETCATAFSRKRPGHARWPPGHPFDAPGDTPSRGSHAPAPLVRRLRSLAAEKPMARQHCDCEPSAQDDHPRLDACESRGCIVRTWTRGSYDAQLSKAFQVSPRMDIWDDFGTRHFWTLRFRSK
jgi:hypothetical protein